MKALFPVFGFMFLAGCAASPEQPVASPESEPLSKAVLVAAPVSEVVLPSSSRAVVPPDSNTEPLGWEEFASRLNAWGDPMRRSMEQYCSPDQKTATKP